MLPKSAANSGGNIEVMPSDAASRGLHRMEALAAEVCAGWLDWIDRRYAAQDRLGCSDPDFSVRSSSLRLTAIPEIDLASVLRAVGQWDLSRWCERALGGPLACDVSQCWVRRQYHPRNYPPRHAPQGWHQDGALRFDIFAYAGQPLPPDALLNMVTCWIPLTPCGSEAPGFQLVTRRLEALLAPAELTEDHVRCRFAPDDFWQPAMKPGDALLFCGDILHRTHVTPAMTKDRTSLELRFFPADNLPARLEGDQFVSLARLFG